MKQLTFAVLSALVAGCWTFNETDYPVTELSPATASAAQLSIAVNGFAALLTEYEAVSGYSTVYVPGTYGHRYCTPGHIETVHTVTYVPQKRTSDMFLNRARDSFEKSGYRLSSGTPDYSVEVEFEGPAASQSDVNLAIAWNLLTGFFCDYSAATWSAKLRIRDNRSGQLVFHHDYTQRYQTNVFGLIPLFGPAACSSTSSAAMQSWCLAALTDRAVADATACLSTIRTQPRPDLIK